MTRRKESPPQPAAPEQAQPSRPNPPPTPDPRARGRRLARGLRAPFFWLAVLPSLLAVLYYGFLASDMYVSEAQLTVRGPQGVVTDGTSLLSGMSSVLGVQSDAYVVYEFMRSLDLLHQLDAEMGLRTHYASTQADFVSRLTREASDEHLLEYFRWVTDVSLDSLTGILTLRTRAFDPRYSQTLALAIIRHSEALVNKMSERAVQDALALAQTELDRAEARVNASRLRLKDFRLRHADFDPLASTTATMTLLAGLEAELAKASTELTQLRSFMREDSAQVVAAKSKVQALTGQIQAEQGRLTGTSGSAKSTLVLEYEALATDHEFAQKLLAMALESMEQARIAAESKTRYLVAFVQPSMPDEPLYPRRMLSILLCVGGALLAYWIFGLTWSSIREHRGH